MSFDISCFRLRREIDVEETTASEIREAVRERFASAAMEAQSQQRASCGCDSGPACKAYGLDIDLETAPDAAIAEMARVLKPGGRLVITDLDRHENYWMAEEMADVWLGFERPQVEEWLKAAGLADVNVDCTGSDCCGNSASGDLARISVFVASGTRM